MLLYVNLVIIISLRQQLCSANLKTFPANFKFGVSTSSYQIEGAWNEDGKGENIWDRFTHTHPERIKDASTGDDACDSYHRYKEDLEILSSLGVDFYRFSLSWSRILPTGFTNKVNQYGINYYNKLISGLLNRNIEPIVTLYHWDLPQQLQDLGGWANPLMAGYFQDYATLAFQYFGKRVKMWITFNEPKLICGYGYGSVKMAPGINSSGIGDYLCGHTVLKAHALAYRIYERDFKREQQGRVGIAIHTEWFEPYRDTAADIASSDRKLMFDFGWFGNPILHPDGDYPTVMKRRIAYFSENQNFKSSRLPNLTEQEVLFIQGTADFLGLNMYTASYVALLEHDVPNIQPSYYNDVGVKIWKDPNWPQSIAKRLTVVPWSFRKLLNWIVKHYGNINIIVTENGYADDGKLEDEERVEFYKGYLGSLLEAIKIDGINVTGFSAWSLIDNFEWFGGYTEKYGLFAVDSKSYRRIPKRSARYYRHVVETKTIEWIAEDDTNYMTDDGRTICVHMGILYLCALLSYYLVF